ncbi:hypothetical protein SK069_04595 [Patulibacter brassicae]|jgi:hypothetical protein|uniref:Uncharacterized protein n=1 Tax=Patulibacter brassicae TaxID=1705717 RepID=A0ABU4VGB3_9ACTN|nr:hypothetical protein [Patulibacter brassicae]MDX8150865.1 hypothetical protein [Patulibacter brassicae]
MPDRAPSPLDRALLALVSGPVGQVVGVALDVGAFAAGALRERLRPAPRR